ncbi:MAG: ComF family protein [Bacteroidota bacterium]
MSLSLPPFSEYLDGFVGLFYPRLCLACRKTPTIRGELTCIRCQYELQMDDSYLEKENAIAEKFWGRIPIETAATMFFFNKGGKIRELVHQLKYKNQYQIGVELGKAFGKKLVQTQHFQSIDCIVPIPLHPKKERKRGYNQSEAIAKGLSESLSKPYFKDGMKRVLHLKSLTRKNRDERFKSIENAYEVKRTKKLTGKHILLVDDVLTTGATIEACAKKILELPDVKLSLVVIACGT